MQTLKAPETAEEQALDRKLRAVTVLEDTDAEIDKIKAELSATEEQRDAESRAAFRARLAGNEPTSGVWDTTARITELNAILAGAYEMRAIAVHAAREHLAAEADANSKLMRDRSDSHREHFDGLNNGTIVAPPSKYLAHAVTDRNQAMELAQHQERSAGARAGEFSQEAYRLRRENVAWKNAHKRLFAIEERRIADGLP